MFPTLRFERLMFSATNYWFVIVADLVAASWFVVGGLRSYRGGPLAALALLAAGALTWPWVEYGVHRWVLHGRRSALQRAHARHHRDATALISAPAFVSIALAVGVWLVLSAAVGAAAAALVVGGVYAGYNYYGLLHHVQHHCPELVARIAWLQRLDQTHRVHHRRFNVNYGVTSGWCDRLLRSDDQVSPSKREATTVQSGTPHRWRFRVGSR